MKNVYIGWVCSLVLAGAAAVQGATPELKVGDKAPPLSLEKLLQAPNGSKANWEALKGKVVVLEFWATWCGPCVAAMPHLNEVADQLKDKPVQIIAITDEAEKNVGPFLKRKPIHAWVGLDTDSSVFKAYAVEGIPHTVVVDPEGNIAAITEPTKLTVRQIEELLARKKPALNQTKPGKSAGFQPGEWLGRAQAIEDSIPLTAASSE